MLHVNFGLRGQESDADESFLARLSEISGRELLILNAESEKFPRLAGESMQIWARRIRHNWFLQISQERKAGIALAHTRSDLTENVLMRIGQGAGPAHLLGMAHRKKHIWRPLLSISRQTLENYAQHEGIHHREDASNAKLDYDRNRVRHVLLPNFEAIYPKVGRKLVALGDECQQMAAFIDQIFVDQFFANGEKTIALSKVEKIPEAIFFTLIRRLCLENGWKNPRLNRLQLSKIYHRIQRHRSLSGRRNNLEWPLSAGRKLQFDGKKITFLPDMAVQDP